MSDSIATPNSLDPQAGSSVSQAANDLRAAAGEKTREFVHSATTQAAALKEKAVESATHFREVAVEKATQFKATAAEKADAFKAAATDKAHHLKESATEHWQDGRVKAKEFQGTAEDYIRANPTKSVLGALGVGFVIGLILRR